MKGTMNIEMYALHRGKDMNVCLECESEGRTINDPREFAVSVCCRDGEGGMGPWMQTLRTKDEVAAWREYRQFEAIAKMRSGE